jgi:hypothetical protein
VVPISPFNSALTNPAYSPFVVRDPSAALQQQILSQDIKFLNETGGPYDPATVAALVDERFTNAAVQRARGVDLSVRDSWRVGAGSLTFSGGAAWIQLREQFTALSPSQEVSGTIFNVPRFKSRDSLTWSVGHWETTGILNYLSGETNNLMSGTLHVGSWTTFDAQLAYAGGETAGLIGRSRIALTIQNLFDQSPPFVDPAVSGLPGLAYDSTNASPLGRFVSLQISKSW